MADAVGEGDGGAAMGSFEAFAAAQWTTLWRFFFGRTGDRELAEELAQETLAGLFRVYGAVERAGDDPPPWERALWTAARHRWIDWLRARPERPPCSLGGLEVTGGDDNEDARLDLLDLLPRLWALPPLQRRALALQIQGLSRPAIGARLGVGGERVHHLLKLARRALRADATDDGRSRPAARTTERRAQRAPDDDDGDDEAASAPASPRPRPDGGAFDAVLALLSEEGDVPHPSSDGACGSRRDGGGRRHGGATGRGGGSSRTDAAAISQAKSNSRAGVAASVA